MAERQREAGARPGGAVPSEVLADVAKTVGTLVTVVGRLAGGLNAGAVRVRLAGGPDAVLKTQRRTRADQLEETFRARRIVEHMRGRGYPTPVWLAVGATAAHVWHLAELVDAAPVRELTPSVVEQLIGVVDLQAGQASEPYDHWSYARRVASGQEASTAALSSYGSSVAALVGRLPRVPIDASLAPAAPDMVHADLNPSNVLVRDGVVVALVDVENAGSGTRAIDLTTLLWHTFREPLDAVRGHLWATIIGLVGWDGTAVLTKAHLLLQLEWPIRRGRDDVVAETVERGHHALDELEALRPFAR